MIIIEIMVIIMVVMEGIIEPTKNLERVTNVVSKVISHQIVPVQEINPLRMNKNTNQCNDTSNRNK